MVKPNVSWLELLSPACRSTPSRRLPVSFPGIGERIHRGFYRSYRAGRSAAILGDDVNHDYGMDELVANRSAGSVHRPQPSTAQYFAGTIHTFRNCTASWSP